jgi:hypothetical protein
VREYSRGLPLKLKVRRSSSVTDKKINVEKPRN